MKTLGFVVAEWIAEYLPSPSDPSKPFILTDPQALFLAEFYALGPSGKYLYRRAALQQAKGWGKSPMAGAIALAEFCGPVIPDGVDANGEPVGRPWGIDGSPPAWVQIAAGSESQAQSNVFSMLWSWLEVNDGAAAEALGIDQGRSRLYLKGSPGAKLEAVTAEAGSREGQRTTFCLLDESHLWTSQTGGIRLARTLLRNAGKMGGRTLECSNAFETGAGSVAEATATAFAAGEAGILYSTTRPHVEPTAEMTDDDLLGLLEEVYAGSPWVDLSRILAEIRDPATGWSEAVRYFLNVPGAGGSAFLDPATWSALESEQTPAKGSRVALAFLGAAVDSAALVLCDAGQVAVIDVWENEPTRRADVEEAVSSTFKHYDVDLFYVDARSWRSEAEAWADRYGEKVVLQWPANSARRMAPALDRFLVAVSEGELHHDGDQRLAQHIANARLVAGRSWHELQAAPGKDITAAVAAVMAFEAAAQMPAELIPLVMWGS